MYIQDLDKNLIRFDPTQPMTRVHKIWPMTLEKSTEYVEKL